MCSQRTILGALPQGPSLARNLPSRLGWLSSKSQGSASVQVPGARVINARYYALLFLNVGSGDWTSCLQGKHFSELSPQPQKISHLKNVFYIYLLCVCVWQSWFSPSTIWAMGIKLRPCLASTHWAISVALKRNLKTLLGPGSPGFLQGISLRTFIDISSQC